MVNNFPFYLTEDPRRKDSKNSRSIVDREAGYPLGYVSFLRNGLTNLAEHGGRGWG